MHRSGQYLDDHVKLEAVSLTQAKSKVVFLTMIVIVVSILFVGIVWKTDVDRAREQFDDHVNLLQDHVHNIILTNQTILESFAAYLSVRGYEDYRVTQDYVKSLAARYPHIYIMEVVHKISSDQIDQVAAFQQQVGNSEYKLKSLALQKPELFVDVAPKPYYFPIVFMEPSTSEQKSRALGLDIESIPFLRRAMMEAMRSGKAVTSQPFELFEGGFGYVMLDPTGRKTNEGVEELQLLALLVVRANAMLPSGLKVIPGSQITIRHPAFLKGEKEGIVNHLDGGVRSQIERVLFPKLTFSDNIGEDRQTVELDIEWQLGWNNMTWRIVIGIVLLAAVLLAVVVIYGRRYQHHEESLRQARYGLFVMANYDSLTQLANKPHLLNHLHNLMSSYHQGKYLLSIVSIEVKGFKDVAHDCGDVIADALLMTVINRVQRHLNDEYFFARIDTAKLMVVSEIFIKRSQAEALGESIRKEFSGPLTIGGYSISASLLIGVSIYPDDGTDIKDLMKLATSNAV